jgi:poly-gamma-glutamate capsule biosynthesis protein CapA/YwtB (metallophosphatase superfamily)
MSPRPSAPAGLAADADGRHCMPHRTLKLFFAGDVMTGRGIDQILPHPSEPQLYETWAHSSLTYVELAERRNGPIARPVDFPYVWARHCRRCSASGPRCASSTWRRH